MTAASASPRRPHPVGDADGDLAEGRVEVDAELLPFTTTVLRVEGAR
ncbi:MAG TPA: hypothetical protein VIG96_11080 [Blastococcus sp.]